MRAKKSGKILSLVLSAVMLLALLPAMGLKAEAAATPVTRTTPLDLATNANISYVATGGSTKTANPTTTDITDTNEGWSWNHTSKTLTLNGANIDCSGYTAGTADTFGLELPAAKIVLTSGSTNTVTCGKAVAGNNTKAYGIIATGNLTVEGSGTLRATGGIPSNPSQPDKDLNSYGIFLNLNKISIKDATVYATGGTFTAGSAYSMGIYAGDGVDLTGSAVLYAHGGTVKGVSANTYCRSLGIRAGGVNLADRATVFAKGGDLAIQCDAPIVAIGATVTGAKEEFTSTTAALTQKTTAPVIIRFGPPPPATFDVVYDVAGNGSGSRLERSLKVEVTDPATGITAADKALGNKVTLKLTVAEKTTVDTAIEGVKQGDMVQYYDVTVEKTVTPADGDPATTTILTSIPKPVQAVIPVPSAIQGKTSYSVYRVHNNVAEKIPNDPTAPEFYTVNPDGTSLTLHVSKFSTYAVITGGKSLTGDVTFGDANNPKRSDMDVQGKVLEGERGVYKLDISWGAMKFDYNAQGMVWNAETHKYDATPGSEGWTKESFEAGNNKITVANHSNGDVMLYYAAKLEAALAGATMTVRATNSLQGVLAENLLLAKVPTENGLAPTVDAYVWLTGNPTNFTNTTYTKAGVITITAEPDKTSGLTPKNTP